MQPFNGFDRQGYLAMMDELTFGKRIRNKIYLYIPQIDDEDLIKLIKTIKRYYKIPSCYNVIKLSQNCTVSFLWYPGFTTMAHPILESYITVNLLTGHSRLERQTSATNPPILHRKELLVPQSYKYHKKFSRLTKEEEKAGLYDYSERIGTLAGWCELLNRKGLYMDDHTLKLRGRG